MSDTETAGTHSGHPNVLKRLAGSALGLMHAHLGILSIELEEARERLLKTLVLGVLGAGLLLLALLAITLGAILLVPEPWRAYTVIALVLAFLLIGAGCLWFAWSGIRYAKTPFALTIEELRRDKEHFLR
ncbi:phage holin family protein [Jeongeupia naejangsanensis]|uniref:Phage holin family protein n=1 Tax=Jeongeupia naejangsanensis TaxID=613195 RepID=A0ABS2BNE7_9NEIS|nr:phage holin family protein [Jeongeupia naejangsanensis]MBM3117073.1 phage holin family protein [Jeongeupia naejangsanensis]